MAVPYRDIDPYKTLGVKKDDPPTVIKKAYYKKCLKYHPDKLSPEEQTKENKVLFEQIQFAYVVLSDNKRRQRYDQTGSLDENATEDDVNWKDLFDSLKDTEITEELIEQDKKVYQNSEEEKEDILQTMEYYEGDFIKLFESIPHLDFSKTEEKRAFEIVEGLVESKELKSFKKWEKYVATRDKQVKKMLKSTNKEAAEAEEMLKAIKAKRKVPEGEDSLLAMIQARRGNFESQIDKIAAKYEAEAKQKKRRRK